MMKTEIYKLDRIEDGIASMENQNGEIIDLISENLPKEAKSGDCFRFKNGIFIPLENETKSRRKIISSLLDEIITEK